MVVLLQYVSTYNACLNLLPVNLPFLANSSLPVHGLQTKSISPLGSDEADCVLHILQLCIFELLYIVKFQTGINSSLSFLQPDSRCGGLCQSVHHFDNQTDMVQLLNRL